MHLIFFPHASYLFLIVLHTRPTSEVLNRSSSCNKFFGKLFDNSYVICEGINEMSFIKDIRKIAAVQDKRIKCQYTMNSLVM